MSEIIDEAISYRTDFTANPNLRFVILLAYKGHTPLLYLVVKSTVKQQRIFSCHSSFGVNMYSH